MNLIFDLDGTLIDSRSRLYHLFQRLAPSSRLSYEEYWELKRNRISNETILKSHLNYGNEAITNFTSDWMTLIESAEFLEMDVNFPGMRDTLSHLKEHADLHVCTDRQSRQPVLDQLDRLNLLPFFSQILVTLQKDRKEDLIVAHVPNRSRGDWILGDTGRDIQVGKRLGIRTCAVLSGFLSRKSLLDYAPDLILDAVTNFSLDS
ncbi:MAG: HAD family hydrolase [Alphaproteobacteria bacterium]